MARNVCGFIVDEMKNISYLGCESADATDAIEFRYELALGQLFFLRNNSRIESFDHGLILRPPRHIRGLRAARMQ